MEAQTQFQTFSSQHFITLGIIFFTALLFVFIGRNKEWQTFAKYLGWTLASIMLLNEIIFVLIAIKQGIWTIQWGLPLQLCDLAIYAVVFSLIKHKQVIWELAYFWGLGGTLQAILTPDLNFSFPSLIFFKFFLTHGCIVVGVIYLSVGLGRPIYFHSLKRVWLISHAYALIIGIFNVLFLTNYGYLCQKPSQFSLLDYFGPWPYYLIGLELVLIASLLLYYIPYWIKDSLDSR